MTFRHATLTAMLAGAILAGGVSCSSPASPTPTIVDVSGNWAGSWTFMTAGATVTDTVSVTFSQNGSTVRGPWSAGTGPGGLLTLVAGESSLVGTVTISQILLNGVNCSASKAVTGTATSTQVTITLGTFAPSGLCQWGSNQQFVLTRSSP